MGKRGRRRSGGRRTASGKRLSRARDAVAEQFPERGPNGPVQRREALFRVFGGPSSAGLELTCAGRLMLVGAFDGTEAQPDAIYSALSEYGRGYWAYYHRTAARISDHGREVRGQDGDGTEIPRDPSGKWFDAVDRALRDCGHQARMAVHSVTVDLHWFPDDDAPWAARIINSRILDKRARLKAAPPELGLAGEPASESDWAMLELLKRGAAALAGGGARIAA